MSEVTELLGKSRTGDAQASSRLFALLYEELHHLARGQLRGDPAMHTTSLVHETFLKLARHGNIQANDREHYFAVAARTMRQIIIDHARARNAQRRGGGIVPEPFESGALQVAAQGRDQDVLDLDAALERLAQVDAPLAALVELRFYAGLDLEQIGELQQRSARTLKREWRRARAFLHNEIDPARAP